VPTAVIGCKDIIVVTTRDAVLVVQKNASEDVKALVAQLKSANVNGSSSPPK
jgi:Mannose-6-phosphate isomerase